MTKLMNLLLCVEAIEAGKVRLSDPITVTAEESKMGGSQVYLKEGEVFTLEELLYATMVQSANDAALACANHVGGSREAFVAAMNARAAQLAEHLEASNGRGIQAHSPVHSGRSRVPRAHGRRLR